LKIIIGLSVISLDKVLEKNYLSARVGDNVQIKCDITGSPSPPIVWKRNGIDLSSLNDDDVSILVSKKYDDVLKKNPFQIHVFNDGSLYLTKINLMHSGNYTCVAQRNQDVVQTHTLLIHSKALTFKMFFPSSDILFFMFILKHYLKFRFNQFYK
jgi:follistatin-related protein 5